MNFSFLVWLTPCQAFTFQETFDNNLLRMGKDGGIKQICFCRTGKTMLLSLFATQAVF
ncbi:hypothetical protein [uncultured Clostridium sp.]|uniref:hypothetical protein n=1 Tax=uncultured Clostridium sp. TaxID=59620 RepID=UPI000A45C4E4|nr:hypothetical protein [uncultured Clostridium sp.]